MTDGTSRQYGRDGTSETGGADQRPGASRRRATLAVLPFLGLGLFDVLLILQWGLDPLWGFLILPPILFVTVVGWTAFRTGFHRNH